MIETSGTLITKIDWGFKIPPAYPRRRKYRPRPIRPMSSFNPLARFTCRTPSQRFNYFVFNNKPFIWKRRYS